MNMTLSKRGDYVVRSALCLARAYEGGSYRKIREVVAEMAVPQTFASQILLQLVRADLAVSRAGKDGGYRLSKAPEAISVLEVVEAAEGPLRSDRCALGDGPCRWDAVCPLHETWKEATNALRGTLGETSLSHLLARDTALERGEYPVPDDSHRHATALVALEDKVAIAAPVSYVHERFADPESWLPRSLRIACDEADRLRRQLQGEEFTSDPPRARTKVSVICSATDEGAYRIAWEAKSTGGITSRFEGTILPRGASSEAAEITISGHFRPPRESPDLAPAVIERVARATVRLALRHISVNIESGWDPKGAPHRD